MIRVQTVGRQEFREGCGQLWDIVQRAFQPDLVVGIRAGGWWVAEEMKRTRNPLGVQFVPLTCRRPTSDAKGKSRAFKLVLKVLPYFLLDILRYIEYYALTLPRLPRGRQERGRGNRVCPRPLKWTRSGPPPPGSDPEHTCSSSTIRSILARRSQA